MLIPHELDACAQRLSDTYQWRKADAVRFVLSGAVPTCQWADVSVEIAGPESRIVLRIDPEMSPRTVMSLYRRVRKMIQGKQRVRPMTEKACEMARAVITEPEGSTWRERMARWNAQVQSEHPAWQYENPNNFNRDTRAALRRLEEPAWSWSKPASISSEEES